MGDNSGAIMSILQVIYEAISAIGQALVYVFKVVVAGVSYTVDTIGKLIEDSVKSIAKDVESSNQSLVNSLLGGIGGVLKGLGADILEVISFVQKALDETNKILNTIQKDVIDKFITPIIKTYDEIKTIETDIQAAIKDGVKGLLELPGVLSKAISAESLAYRQATLLSDKNTADLVNNQLIPGLGDQIGGHVKTLSDTFKEIYSTVPEPFKEWTPQNLSEPTGIYDWVQEKTELDDFLAKAKWPINSLLKDLWRGLLLFEAQVATFEAYLSQATQAARLSTPVQPLQPSDAVNAAHRNLIDMSTLETELGRQGLSKDRADLLYTLADQLLAASDLVRGNYRGIVDNDHFKEEMNNLNYTEGRQAVLLELFKFLPDPGLLASLFIRQIINKAEFEDALKKNGWEAETIAAYESLVFRPTQTDTYARFIARRTQAENGFLPDSYKSVGPEGLHTLAGMNGLDDTAADMSWLAHWRDVDAFTWINAEYRSLLGDGVFSQAMASLNYPPEVNKILLEANRPLISFFYTVEMLSAGVFTIEEATAYLKRYGFDDFSIQAIIKFADYKALGKATEANVSFANLSVANLKTMYDDGIITSDQLEQGLLDHGYDAESANLLMELYVTSKQLKDRKAYVTTLGYEVRAGMVTMQAALDDLGGKGYSEGEIAQFQYSMRNVAATQAKLPTTSELKAMYKAELITADEYVATLELLGYSTYWAERLAALA